MATNTGTNHTLCLMLLTCNWCYHCHSLVFTVWCTTVQSALLRSQVVCLSVRLWRWWIVIT